MRVSSRLYSSTVHPLLMGHHPHALADNLYSLPTVLSALNISNVIIWCLTRAEVRSRLSCDYKPAQAMPMPKLPLSEVPTAMLGTDAREVKPAHPPSLTSITQKFAHSPNERARVHATRFPPNSVLGLTTPHVGRQRMLGCVCIRPLEPPPPPSRKSCLSLKLIL